MVIIWIVCFPNNTFCQKKGAHKYIVLQHPFGIKDTSIHRLTYEQLLANTVLNYREPNCEVTEYKISFLPKGKNYIGPFTIKGASKIQGKPLDILKELKVSKNENTRIFFDDIHVKYNGEEWVSNSIFMTCTP